MKILYITYEGFDTPNAANQMAETMINAFLEQGHTVYLIQSHRKGVIVANIICVGLYCIIQPFFMKKLFVSKNQKLN